MSNFLYFPERKIKPYSGPVSAKELRFGQVYFRVNYTNGDLLIPVMKTDVFIGRNLYEGNSDNMYFQDIRSYLKGEHYDLSAEAQVICMDENQTGDVFEYERALDCWLLCELRRNRSEESVHLRNGDSSNKAVERGYRKLDPSEAMVEWSDYIAATPELRENDEYLAQFIADMSAWLFDARNLPAQPQPVKRNEVIVGSTYFLLEYADDEKQIPVMDTVVFIGENLKDGDQFTIGGQA